MDEKKRSNKEIMGLILFTAIVCLGVLNISTLAEWIGSLLGMLKPFFIGGCIAFVVNLPLKTIEEKLLKKFPQSLNKSKRGVSILLSLMFIIAVIVFVILTVIPQLGSALTQLGQKIPVFLENAITQTAILLADSPEAVAWLNSLDFQKFNWEGIFNTAVAFLKTGVSSLWYSTVSVAGNVAGGVVNGIISFIFSLYILSQKEKLKNQAERIIHAYFTSKVENRILYVSKLLYRNFSKFITGQCVEAVILGTLFVIAMSIAGMPYAFMIGVLIAFTALIPVVGAFIGCFVGAFLILVDNPVKALVFVIMFLIIQQLEGNLIYPKVVGNSVGLPSIWVLAAVTLGSGMFGVVGMLVFIPLFSTGYTLLKEDVNRRNRRKKHQMLEERKAEQEEAIEEVEQEEEPIQKESREWKNYNLKNENTNEH